MNNALLYKGDLSYESLFYREIIEHLVGGMGALVSGGILPSCYQESFKQGAEICRSYLVGAGYDLDEYACSDLEKEEATLVKHFLKAVMDKHADVATQRYPLEKIEDITRALIFLSGGSAHRTSYPQDQLESMYDFFWELRETFNKECEESGIIINSSSLITQASHTLQ